MSLCQQCLKDSSEHTKAQWRKHQEQKVKESVEVCILCQRMKGNHSEKQWEVHEDAVKNELMKRRETKIWPIQEYGRIKPYPATVETLAMADGREIKVLTPIYMSCKKCGLFVGNKEEDLVDVLGGMCFKCFCEETEQEYTWHTVTPTFEEMQKRQKTSTSEVGQ